VTWLLVAVVVAANSAGQVAITHGMKTTGEITDFRPGAWLRALARALRNGWLWLGIFGMAVAFFAFMALLSAADLSFAVPATASSYVVQTLGARFFLGERVSAMRWAGTALVMCGVVLVSL
jgi:drug/metabolite transporter (DMT)-like permease